jgi:isochorismate hydrolase
VDGRCSAADISYYHQSINSTPNWRGLLLIDMWHPGLTPTECTLLERTMPHINDILRKASGKEE